MIKAIRSLFAHPNIRMLALWVVLLCWVNVTGQENKSCFYNTVRWNNIRFCLIYFNIFVQGVKQVDNAGYLHP